MDIDSINYNVEQKKKKIIMKGWPYLQNDK